MSTLRVTNIQNPSAGSPSIVLDSSGGMSGAFPSPNRNLLYNGAMQVSQRGTSTTGITTAPSGDYYTADRWKFLVNLIGTWTQDIQNDAPTGSGFRRSVRLLCTTADAAPAAGDYLIFSQLLEGQDLQRVRKGTSSAQKLTISFWVKANVTGTYVVELRDPDNARGISASYTVSASATWERKTVTFSADTTGAFDNDNAVSLEVNFWLGAGSTYTSGTLATTWASLTNANRAVGQTNLAAATNNYWQITGVQLEVGAVATPFEFKSYGQELRECQRYFEICGAGGSGMFASSTNASIVGSYLVTKRANPSSVSFFGATANVVQFNTANRTATGFIDNGCGVNSYFVDMTGMSGGGTNAPAGLTTNCIAINSEL